MVPCNGLRLLDRLGVYDQLSLRAPKSKESVLYSSQGEQLGELVLGSWSAMKTGYWAMRIKRTDLQEVLSAAAQKEGIPIHYGKRVVGIEERNEEVAVTFSDGTVDTADLLLGCDGTHSSVRTLYVDPGLSPDYSGISTIYSFVPVSDLPPAGSVTNLTGTLTPHGLFALMPCTTSGDTLYWFFSYEVPIPASGSSSSRDGWVERSQMEEAGFKPTLLALLEDVHTQWGTLLRDVVRKTEVVKFYPIYRLPLGGRWSRGRCLLVGDAAHAMQPHVGQGVSMALEDVFLLSRLLLEAAAASSSSLSATFDKFDEIRRPRVEKFAKLAAGRGEWRKKTGPWAQWLKETLFWAGLNAAKWASLNRWGLGEGDLVYDIDEVAI